MKKNNKFIIIIILVIILFVCGFFLLNTKNDDSNRDVSKITDFYGVYENGETKIFIKEKNDNTISYTIDGNGFHQGEAKVDKKTATEKSEEGTYILTLTDDGINLEVKDKSEDYLNKFAEKKYKKIAEYTKEEVYKQEVGDPKYLSSKYSGIYKNNNIEMLLFQISEKEVQVSLNHSSDANLPLFDQIFEIVDDNKLVAKSYFNENEIRYEITFNDKSFTLKANKDAVGYNDDDKKIELTYTYASELSQEEIISRYYDTY